VYVVVRLRKITHYYNKLGVATIEVEHGRLQKGDHIHIVGHSTDFEQTVESMELQHQQIIEAREGQDVGVEVEDYVRENDFVYKSHI